MIENKIHVYIVGKLLAALNAIFTPPVYIWERLAESKPARAIVALEHRLPLLCRILLYLGPPSLLFIPIAILLDTGPLILAITYCGVALLFVSTVVINVRVGREPGKCGAAIKDALRCPTWYRLSAAVLWIQIIALVALVATVGIHKEGPVPYKQSVVQHAIALIGPEFTECAR